jgi:hypothetical protein
MEQMTNLERAVSQTVAAYIEAHTRRTLGDGSSSRVSSYPERFVHAQRQPDGTMLLSFAENVMRDSYESLFTGRDWLFVELLVEGILCEIKHPLPLDNRGMGIYTSAHNTGTPEGLRDFFKEVRGNKPHPLLAANGLRVLRTSICSVSSTDRMASWPAHGRPVAALNKWLTRFAIPTLDTTQGNALLAQIDDVLQEQRALCAWAEGGIGRFYSAHTGVLYSSCMTGANESWFALYDHMRSEGKLKLLNITRGGAHIGRALVWFGSNPDDLYLDRVYAPPYRDSFEPDVVKAVQDFCREEGITKTVFAQTAERIGLPFVGGFSIDTGAQPSDFSYYPYVDSLRYFGHDGRLRMQNSHSCIVLDQTNGGPNGEDDEDYVTLENGDRVPEEDACYSTLFGEWYYSINCTWSDLHDDWIPDNELRELHNGDYTYREDDNVRELHDGEYALLDDCVELHDGEYALHDDCVQLLDGSYALQEDCVELHDGSYALYADCVELHDGEYALHADCVQLLDGSYALLDDCVQLPDDSYALRDDCVQLPDDSYALRDDCTEQNDGTYVLSATQEN